jgi:Arc/MetJ-type ribon-helix-helix transcriptional regulator
MPDLSISLPESVVPFVESQVAARGYHDASAYVQALIEADRECLEDPELEAMLLKGVEELNRGDCKEMTGSDWQTLRENLLRKNGTER